QQLGGAEDGAMRGVARRGGRRGRRSAIVVAATGGQQCNGAEQGEARNEVEAGHGVLLTEGWANGRPRRSRRGWCRAWIGPGATALQWTSGRVGFWLLPGCGRHCRAGAPVRQ